MPGHLDFVTELPISGLYYKESGHPDYVTSVPKCAVQMKLRPGRGGGAQTNKVVPLILSSLTLVFNLPNYPTIPIGYYYTSGDAMTRGCWESVRGSVL